MDKKRAWERAVTLLLALTLCATGVSPRARGFADTAGHWAEDAVGVVTDIGLFQGTGDDAFDPDGVMSRAMYVTALGRLYEAEGYVISAEMADYSDVPADAYYAEYVAWAAEAEIVHGYGDGRFGPGDPVTREQMVTILYRYADHTDNWPEITVTVDRMGQYADAGEISPWALEAVEWGVMHYILSGSQVDGVFTLAPGELSTRAQVASVLERFICQVYLRKEWHDQDVAPRHIPVFTLPVSTLWNQEQVYVKFWVENPSEVDYLVILRYEDTGEELVSGTVPPGDTGVFTALITGGPDRTADIIIAARDSSPLSGNIKIITGATEQLVA